MSDRRAQRLAAYHDGELSWLARWRVKRLVARDPQARSEFALLSEIGDLLRENDADAGSPDLWAAIRAELPGAVPASAAQEAPAGAWPGGWLRWAAPALAAAATALALTFGLEWGDAPDFRSVRWLDAAGKPAMVLQDDREATIIWVVELPVGESRRTGGALS